MESKSTFRLNVNDPSNMWLRPFSVLINCLFPIEYIYGDWYQWIETSKAKRLNPESLGCPPPNEIETGSRVEGFCYPQILVAKSADCPPDLPLRERVYWQPDLDCMAEHEPFQENSPHIFTVEHIAGDPRYVRLRITNEWKEYKPRYKGSTFLNQSYLMPSKDRSILGAAFDDRSVQEIHGPVVKRTTTLTGYENFQLNEEDNTGVFKYPQAWPETAMDWLIRPRNSWPSPELLQDVFESGCHIAPVGRGKRVEDPMELFDYIKDPSQASTSKETEALLPGELAIMDQTEWRMSFSVAENKLGQSVTPVQRHVLILLKMLKKLYFPDIVSSYHLKNLLFWEIENQEEAFWNEDFSAKYLVHMLDRLQQCLEVGCIPHYIIPTSNLLQYEDPEKLLQGATVVKEVKNTILFKTIHMFKRIISLTYVSPFYLKTFDWQSVSSNFTNLAMSEDEANKLTSSLLHIFTDMCKNVIAHLLKSAENEDFEVREMMSIPVGAYKSLLGRCLCKLYLLGYPEGTESDFIAFVKDRDGGVSGTDTEFTSLLHRYFEQAQNGTNLSNVVPCSAFLQLTRERYAKTARRSVEESSGHFGQLQSSDLLEAQKRVTEKLQKRGVTLENISIEEIKREFENELQALYNAKNKL